MAAVAHTTPALLPMLLTEVPEAFSDDEWTFEVKLDGIRVLAHLDGNEIQLMTRNSNQVEQRFPNIVDALQEMGLRKTVLDGELVVLDAKGVPSFQKLAAPFQAGLVNNALFYVFDLLFLDGEDLRSKPWTERRSQLESLEFKEPVKLLDSYGSDGKLLFDTATEMGYEGVVGKRLRSRYQPGVRSPSWVKIKRYHSEEFLVGAYTAGKGAREPYFGALALGKPTPNGLRYAGDVGGGFDFQELEEIASSLRPLATDSSPFDTPLPIRYVHWVKPELSVEVRFMSWTADGHLRFPTFLRARPDLSKGGENA